jgi:hypothetical protein
MQPLGTMLFVGTECSDGVQCNGEVQVMDVRDPAHARIINVLEIDNSHGQLGQYRTGAAGAAAVRLTDGRYLVFTRGSETNENGWFFVSDRPGITPDTHWNFVNGWQRKADLPAGDPWYPWENFSFITECGTGDIYFMGLGSIWNHVGLYRLTTTDSKLGFKAVAERELNSSCLLTSARFGGGIHITPGGDFVTYVTDRHPPFKIEEFDHH